MSNSNGVITQADGLLVEFRNTLTGSVVASTTVARTPRGTARLSKAGEWSLALPMTAYDPATMGIDQYVTVSADMPVGADVVLFRGRVDKVKQEFTKGIRWVRLSGPDQLGSEWGTTEIMAKEIYDTVVERVAAVAREYWQAAGAPGYNSSEFMPEANDGNTGTAAVLWLVDNDHSNFPEHLEDVATEHIYLYVGHVAPFDQVHFDFNPAWVQEQVATLRMQQFLPATEWTEIALTGNTTVVSGKPLAQDGIVSFAKSDKEIPLTHAKANLYWVRFFHTGTGADLDGILIQEIQVRTAGPATNDIQQVMTKCAPAGWTLHGSSPTGTTRKHQMNVVGENALRALVRLAEHSGENFALTNTTQIRWMASPISSGITAKEIIEGGDSATSCYITDLQRVQERRELVTRVYLEGSGDDPDAAVNLSYLRAGTYTLPSGYAIAGNILAHTALEGELGKQIQKRLKFPDIGALWGGTGGNPQAALELLKAGLAYLDIHKEHSEHFTATLTGINKTLAQFHPGMTMGVQSAIYDADGEVVEEIDATLVVVEVTRSMDLTGNISYDVILGKQAEYVPAAAYLAAMKLLKDSDRNKHFQASSGLRLVQGGVVTTGGGGGSGGSGGGGVDWVTFYEHLADTFDAHEIPTQIDAKIATHTAIADAHHDPVTVTAPITLSDQHIELSISFGLHVVSNALRVNVGNGITFSGGAIAIDLESPSGLEFNTGNLRINVGNALTLSGDKLNVSPALLAGDGLMADGDDLAVDTGNGLEISAGKVRVKPSDIAGDGLGSSATKLSLSPSTLSAASTNAASGSGHTHAIAAVSDAHATPNALLKAIEGYLKLRDLDIHFDLVVGQNAFVGQDLEVEGDLDVGEDAAVGNNVTAGNNVVADNLLIAKTALRVGSDVNIEAFLRTLGDIDTGKMALRKLIVTDEDMTLDVKGVTRSDWYIGKFANQVRGAAMICHYENSLHSTTGTSFTASGAVGYADSSLGRALQSYGDLVNRSTNPSFEGTYASGIAPNWSAYNASSAGSRTEESAWVYQGVKAQGLNCTSATTGLTRWGVVQSIAAGGGTKTYCGVYVYVKSYTAGARVTIYLDNGGGAGFGYIVQSTTITAAMVGKWTLVSGLNSSHPASSGTISAFVWVDTAPADVVMDSFAFIEGVGFLPPHFDGASPGCTWSGTKHASTSTRPALSLQYLTRDVEDWTRLLFREAEGSILAWVKLGTVAYAHPLGSDPQYYRTILYLESGVEGAAVALKISPTGYPYVMFQNEVWSLHDTALTTNLHMLALTWDLAAGSHKVYLDGVEVAIDDSDNVYSGFQIVPGDPFNVASSQPLNGLLAQLVVSTSCLTAEEILLIHQSNAPIIGINTGQNLGFSIETPKGRIWADNQGIHFADNEGNEVGKQYMGEGGKAFINNDVEELRIANGTVLLNDDGITIEAPTEDVPEVWNKINFVEALSLIASIYNQFTALRIEAYRPEMAAASVSLKAVPGEDAGISLELIGIDGGGHNLSVDGDGQNLMTLQKDNVSLVGGKLRFQGNALIYKNAEGDDITVGSSLADDDWIAPSLSNSWVNFDGTKSSAGYRKTARGTVVLKGVLKSGSSATATMFTLPAGYRPSQTRRYPAAANTALGIVEVTTGGGVSFVVGGSTTQSSLDGIEIWL